MKGTAKKMYAVFDFTDPADRAYSRLRALLVVLQFTTANTTEQL